jgi:hypothetical protein
MTNEEARAWLEHHFDPLPDGTKQSEAVSLAIKALEQGDVLREIRQGIENRINNCGDGTFKDGLCEAFDIVYCKMKELSE